MNPDSVSKPRILIVDDTPAIINLLLAMLSPHFQVTSLTDGKIAFDLVVSASPRPDLVLLDMVMPGIDGIEICEQLKKHPATRDIPVIFLTGMVDETRISAGFAAGAVDYVRKPFNQKELMARIKTHVKLRQSIETLTSLSQKLGKYLPHGLYESIFSGRNDITINSERKMLTICFTDIVGFTRISEGMSNRDLTEWLNAYLNKMVEIALRYGAVLDKFIGDGILLFFGDLNPLDLRTETINCVKMLREMILAANAQGINIRAGVNTGECYVGNFGSENHMEYGVIGKEVNVASRLESNSESNRILITQPTYEFIRDEFECILRGEINLKGIDRPVVTYWVK